jgi:hypothetical protein
MADWLKKANEMLGDIAGQAGRQAEILQLQAKLGSLDNDLERVYIEAGKRAEELVQQRQVLDEELRVILDRARVIRDEMMELRQKTQDLRGPEQPEEPAGVPEAVEPPTPTAAPAPAVPTRVEATAVPEEEAGHKFCTQCGEKVQTHAVWCANCGAKLQS